MAFVVRFSDTNEKGVVIFYGISGPGFVLRQIAKSRSDARASLVMERDMVGDADVSLRDFAIPR